jgi:hypothetical protein
LTGKKLGGYLDHLRENLEILDEQIVNARRMSRKKGKDSNALQWAKTLRDLVELRNTTLVHIKTHLLGRDETGSPNEPHDIWAGNSEVEYERHFRSMLSPWTQQHLKLKCEDCNKESEEVFSRSFKKQVSLGIGDVMITETEHHDLCSRCYAKRAAKDERTDESESGKPIPNVDVTSEDPSLEAALTGAVQNTIRLTRMGGDSPAEKIKTLEDFKASVCQSAKKSHSEHVLAPGLVMLDAEIQRLRAEAAKSQDAAGKPAT